MKYSKEELIVSCVELNDVLGLSPQIDITLDYDILLKIINKVAPLVAINDNLSDSTIAILLDVGGLSDEVASIFEKKISISFSDVSRPAVIDKEPVVANESSPRRRKPHMSRIEELIAEGRHTSNQIVTIILSEFPTLKKDTISNYIRSAKSEKYTQFGHVAIEDINGVLRFVE